MQQINMFKPKNAIIKAAKHLKLQKQMSKWAQKKSPRSNPAQ